MTNEERVELLRRVAEVAPKEMGAYFVGPDEGLDSCRVEAVGPRGFALDLHDWGSGMDYHDAAAIIAMLDAMEKAGYAIGLVSFTPGARWYRVEWWRDLRDARDNPGRCEFDGDTRAEAVARAFVRVFGGD